MGGEGDCEKSGGGEDGGLGEDERETLEEGFEDAAATAVDEE